MAVIILSPSDATKEEEANVCYIYYDLKEEKQTNTYGGRSYFFLLKFAKMTRETNKFTFLLWPFFPREKYKKIKRKLCATAKKNLDSEKKTPQYDQLETL